MDHHINEYFSEFSKEEEGGNFHRVLAVHEQPDLDWERLSSEVQHLPRGWFELAHLTPEDRVEFTKEYVLGKLPYQPAAQDGLIRFFQRLDDIGIYVTQKTMDDPYEAQLVYSIAENGGFYHGYTPALEEDVIEMEKAFPDLILPADFIAFLRIHDGFSKYSDTGITRTRSIPAITRSFHQYLRDSEPLTTHTNESVNPKSLIPFYESFGLHGYQCFWADWYPAGEMGNVYYSGIEKTLSNPTCGTPAETLAFPTFLDWLAFYVEEIS